MTTAAPKVPESSRWQFSLRTLFIVVTVLCVWMAVIAKQAQDQRLAVEAILEMGGTVWYEHGEVRNRDFQSPQFQPPGLGPPSRPPGPEWLRRIIGNEYFFNVTYAVLNGSGFDDANLEMVSRFSKLNLLQLSDAQITDAGLVHLRESANLQILILNSTRVTEGGIKKLQQAIPGCTIRHTWRLSGKTKIYPPLQDSPLTP